MIQIKLDGQLDPVTLQSDFNQAMLMMQNALSNGVPFFTGTTTDGDDFACLIMRITSIIEMSGS